MVSLSIGVSHSVLMGIVHVILGVWEFKGKVFTYQTIVGHIGDYSVSTFRKRTVWYLHGSVPCIRKYITTFTIIPDQDNYVVKTKPNETVTFSCFVY